MQHPLHLSDMKILVQRVSNASVDVIDDETKQPDQHFPTQHIDHGLLLFVGVSDEDDMEQVQLAARKIANLRIFEDKNGKMNLSVLDVQGQILSISQFTLFANTRHGNRPSFTNAGKPDHAKAIWDMLNKALKSYDITVKTGRFGSYMRVSLLNDGPVTIPIDTADM